jgi:hypothetical protein
MGAVAMAAPFMGISLGFAQSLTLEQFKADPGQALSANPDGGAHLISLIRQFALADPNSLPLIINLLMTASPAQASATGCGLGQAALASVRTNQLYATRIQEALGAVNNPDAHTCYASITGTQPIGAVGAGGAGSNGGVGGQTSPLPTSTGFGSTGNNFGNQGAPTSVFTATGSVSPAGQPVATGSVSVTTGSVSPAGQPVATGRVSVTTGSVSPAGQPVATGRVSVTTGSVFAVGQPVSP